MGAMKPKQAAPTAAERLKAAGRLEGFEARRSQLRATAASAEGTPKSDEPGPAGATGRAGSPAELAKRIAGLRALLKSLPAGKRVPSRNMYDWAGEHLECEADEIDPSSVPNRLSLQILIQAIETPEGFERFIARHKSLSGGETAGETWARFEDDGRNLDAFMARVAKLYEEEEAAEKAKNASAGKSRG